MTDSEFQHYVPRFYLTGWATTVEYKGRRIWINEAGADPRHASIDKTGGEENFYAVKAFDGSTDIQTVEKYLADGEGKAGRAFVKIKNRDKLSAKERKDFADFLALLVRRTPYTREKSAKLVEKFLPGAIEPLRQSAEKIPDEERRNKILENIERVAADVLTRPESITAAAMLQPSDIGDIIARMDWAFLYHPTLKFVTSDNPFVYSMGLGIGDFENGHIIFPISNNLSFQAKHSSKFNDSYNEISDDLLAEINLRIVRHAYRQVYSSDNSAELTQCVDENIGADLHDEIEAPSEK
jgi:hypothetical protein